MKSITHRFLHYKPDPATEILIVGTFNPHTEKNPAEVFYGRSRNFLWRLLPLALGASDLKNESVKEKLRFINEHKISFTDLIAEVSVDTGSETNYGDNYLDSRVSQWRNVMEEINLLPHLKKVCFTRKTFSDIPNIKKVILEIERFCKQKGIAFQYLTTPARIYSKEKQAEWTAFFKS